MPRLTAPVLVVGLVALVAARRRMGDIAARATGTRIVTNQPAGSGAPTPHRHRHRHRRRLAGVTVPERLERLAGRRRKPAERSVGRQDWSTWPTYDEASLGLRNYWYPVMWSRDVGAKPVPVKLLGDTVMLMRDGGTVAALHDRCPHRGVPLSLGTQIFPGTITCRVPRMDLRAR